MSSDATAATLDAARAALDRGDRATARSSLMQFVRAPAGRQNGEAWWLLAQTLDDPQQQADCYARARTAGYTPSSAVPVAAQPTPQMPDPTPHSSTPPPQPVQMPTVQGDAAVAMPSATYTPVNQPAAADADVRFVVQQLGSSEDRHEIVEAMMQRHDWDYAQAERFVGDIEAHHERTIARRQQPSNLAVNSMVLIVGIILAIAAVLYLRGAAWLPFVGMINGLLFLGLPVVPIILLIVGAGMALGGLLGLLRNTALLGGRKE